MDRYTAQSLTTCSPAFATRSEILLQYQFSLLGRESENTPSVRDISCSIGSAVSDEKVKTRPRSESFRTVADQPSRTRKRKQALGPSHFIQYRFTILGRESENKLSVRDLSHSTDSPFSDGKVKTGPRSESFHTVPIHPSRTRKRKQALGPRFFAQ